MAVAAAAAEEELEEKEDEAVEVKLSTRSSGDATDEAGEAWELP